MVGGYAVGLHGFPFIGLEELLKNKAASPRGKDQIDLTELKKARRSKASEVGRTK